MCRHAPATTNPNCRLSCLLLLYGLQGQRKRRVLFAAFVIRIATISVQEPQEGVRRREIMKHLTLLALAVLFGKASTAIDRA